jgi:hypothetical protein
MCGQELFNKMAGSAGLGQLWVCINTKCPDYFEKALRQDTAKAAPAYTFTNDGEAAFPNADEVRFATSGIGRAPGVKLDKGKPPVFTEFLMQFPRAIRMITRVGAKGTEAPGHVRSGWKAVIDGYLRYSDAQARHLIDEAILGGEARLLDETEEGTDPVEDLIWQAATVAWNDLARLELLIRENRAAAERLDPRAAP